MKRPWMPLYVADYLADTAHRNATQSGAYLHLIMHYWLHEKLPTEDHALARIAKLTPSEWKRFRPLLSAFFQDDWKHKRIEFELTESARISAAGRTGGIASGAKRRERLAQRSANDKGTISERSLNDPLNDQGNDSTNDPRTKREALQLQLQREERKKDAAPNGAHSDLSEDGELYRRGRQLLGENAGGLVKKLKDAKGGSIPLARAALEMAATKDRPREYVNAIIRGKEPAAAESYDPRL